MLANPNYYNPEKNLERVQNRQKRLLALLQTEHMINDEEYQAALQVPLELHIRKMTQDSSPKTCPLNLLRDYVVKTYGETQLLGGGLRLKTTLDLTLQRMLEGAAAEAGVSLSQNSTPLLLAVKEGETTRGLICIENGGLGMQVIKHLDQTGTFPKDDVFSFESLETFRWEPLFPAQAATVSAP
jgi:membrane peptidoglycan carboxypeptidase